MQTRAIEDGDDFVVSGSKIWNSGHANSDWMFMLVRTDPDAPKHRGISFVLSELETEEGDRSEGVTIEKIPMMWNAYRGLVTFDNVRVPKKNLVGELNRGWYVGAALLDFERSGVEYPATARRNFEEIVDLVKNTKDSLGVPLIKDPYINKTLVDLDLDIEAARLVAYEVAYLQSQGEVPSIEGSVAKISVSYTHLTLPTKA